MKRNIVVLFKGNPYRDSMAGGGNRVPLIPLSLISLASPLREAGYVVKIVDQNGFVKDVFSSLGDIWDKVVCVGISALTGKEILEAIEFTGLVKEKDPSIPIAWGGWHVSILPEQSLQHPNVDIVVEGLGQKTFVNLVKVISTGYPLEGVKNIYYKNKEKVVYTGSEYNLRLESFSLPAFDLLDIDYYREYSLFLKYKENIRGLNIKGHLYYVSSFGCPNECAYCCSNRMFGKKMFRYDVRKVVDQIQWLVNEKKFNSISFMDANFFIDANRVKELCELFIKEKLCFVWDAQIYVKDIIRYEQSGLWPLMVNGGCWRVNIGTETGSQKLLYYMRKKIVVDEIYQSARILSKHNVEGAYNFLFALPREESKKDIFASFELAKNLKEINPEFVFPVSFYVPFPGTTMYEDALTRGLLSPSSLEEWGGDLIRAMTPRVTNVRGNRRRWKN
jgi:anaerobic magnesium-protoporphyrin IX monomethyl ester cyclase